MRRSLTKTDLIAFMKELARSAPRRGKFKVYFVGGGTAVFFGWRASTIDADICADDEAVLRDIQEIKQRLDINIEFARPEHFVPALARADDRHVHIDTIGNVSFFHYDPYSQMLAKVVRGIENDLEDAAHFLASGLVDAARFRELVNKIPAGAYARYPAHSREALVATVEDFLANH